MPNAPLVSLRSTRAGPIRIYRRNVALPKARGIKLDPLHGGRHVRVVLHLRAVHMQLVMGHDAMRVDLGFLPANLIMATLPLGLSADGVG